MTFRDLPPSAAWRHTGAREGFEAVFMRADGPGWRIAGHTAAVEEGRAWAVRYEIELDEHWTTVSARAWGQSPAGRTEVRLGVDRGRWHVNGSAVPALDGCVDVDLESSVCTNAIPVHRLGLVVGQSAEAPAVYVRALDLAVARLDQEYERVSAGSGRQAYDYRSPAFDFAGRLSFDDAGLLVDYPGLAARVA